MRRVASLMSAGLICALAGCVNGGVGSRGIGVLGIPPSETSPQDIANFEAAAASIGCNLITEGDFQAVEIQTGMTREQVMNLTKFELDAGKAAPIEGGGVQVQSGACSPQNA